MSACAAAGARWWACARSTTKSPPPSPCIRTPRAFTALAAARAATPSPLCAKSTTLAMSKPSSSWPPVPGCRCQRRTTRRAAPAAACSKSTAAPPAIFTNSSTPARRKPPPPAATGRKSAAFRTPRSAVLAWAMRRKISPACCTTCAAAALPKKRTGTFRPHQAQPERQPLRYLPPPRHGAHHRRARQHHRFGGRVLDDSKPKYINSPKRRSTKNPARCLRSMWPKNPPPSGSSFAKATWMSSACTKPGSTPPSAPAARRSRPNRSSCSANMPRKPCSATTPTRRARKPPSAACACLRTAP